VEHELVSGNGEVERFYRLLPQPSLVGLESCGNSQWFLDLLERLGHEVWIGDAAQIRASYVRKQKTDKRDARHILKKFGDRRDVFHDLSHRSKPSSLCRWSIAGCGGRAPF
jgi:transposase